MAITYRLQLFVSGQMSSSRRAVESIRRLCLRELPDRHELEIVDVFEQPERAEENKIMAVPTLVRRSPSPERRVVGDLSERKRVMSALGLRDREMPEVKRDRTPKMSFEPLIAMSPDGMVLVDGEGCVLFANPTAASMLGKSAAALRGQRFGYPLVHGEATEVSLAGGGVAELRAVSIVWEGRKAHAAALRDVTQRKRVEELLRELNAQLQAATEAKSRFVANASHDLRTPLNAMNNYLQLLDEEIYGPLNAKQHGAISSLQECLATELRLVGDLLDLSRIEAGELELQPEPIDVERLCRDVVETARSGRKGDIEVQLEVAPGLPALRTDPLRMKQILTNLVSNALKFTERGTVRLCAARSAEPDHVDVSVVDTGIGIPSSQLDSIFEPFRQLDDSSKRTRQGAGLGLHIAKRLAELLEGRLLVTSESGKGSTFTLRLALARS